MPASVQELLAAAQAKQSPFMSLLQGVAQGYGNSMQQQPERDLKAFQLAQAKAEADRRAQNDQMLRQQLAGQTEQANTQAFNGAATQGKPVQPGMRLAGASVGEDGYLKGQYKIVEPKSDFEAKSYQDAQGVNRIGRFNKTTGEIVMSPNDPLAPKMANAAATTTDLDSMAQDLATGNIAPSQIPALLGRGGAGTRIDLFNRAKKINPNFNPAAAEQQYQGALAGSKLSGGGSSQVTARTAQSALEQMGTLEDISRQFPRSDAQFMNTAINKIKGQYSTQAQNWLTAINSVRYEYASALARGNKPSEEDLKDAKAALPDNITPAQLTAVIPVMKSLLGATVRGQMTQAGAAPLGAAPVAKFAGPGSKHPSQMSNEELLQALGQ